ncbi:MAG: SPOR domain-containing protein, partial [Clostridia bacterium]|nr:SPOR domain-containing protein [Clostridia bacterium]
MSDQGLKTVTYKTPGTGLRIFVCLVLTAGIALGAGHLYRRFGVKLPFTLAPEATAAPRETSAARRTQEVTFSAHTLYALQLGAFTQQSAAQQLAQEYAARGAAGYVAQDGDAYRVL